MLAAIASTAPTSKPANPDPVVFHQAAPAGKLDVYIETYVTG
jgi:hypothetical protein